MRGLHLRLSLCRVSLRQGSDSRLVGIDDAYLITERLGDGSLIVIFIHPPGVNDDASAEQVLSRRLLACLQKQGLAIWALRFAAMHCDAAAIDDGHATLEALFDKPLRPLNRPRLAV
ncbi:hypothetical protein HBA54_10630 [Pelagibius litoralis]|uniref:Uncharacterized protein n=1 Tax=Pelagibius litoralis TaxID=374515 RepID=A0A967C291_9PROT|nr:hypothetical protein [Pelagibius litoralis]